MLGDVKGCGLVEKEATCIRHLVLQRSPRTCAQRHQPGRMMHSNQSVKTMNIGSNLWHSRNHLVLHILAMPNCNSEDILHHLHVGKYVHMLT